MRPFYPPCNHLLLLIIIIEIKRISIGDFFFQSQIRHKHNNISISSPISNTNRKLAIGFDLIHHHSKTIYVGIKHKQTWGMRCEEDLREEWASEDGITKQVSREMQVGWAFFVNHFFMWTESYLLIRMRGRFAKPELQKGLATPLVLKWII